MFTLLESSPHHALYSAGTLMGTRSQVRGALGNGAEFDGTTVYMNVAGSTGLHFGSCMTIQAFGRRDSIDSEDAIVSKWDGGNQFALVALRWRHRRGQDLAAFLSSGLRW